MRNLSNFFSLHNPQIVSDSTTRQDGIDKIYTLTLNIYTYYMYNLSDLISVSWHVRFPVELTMLAPGTAYMAEVSTVQHMRCCKVHGSLQRYYEYYRLV